jgi:hypothetical protein
VAAGHGGEQRRLAVGVDGAEKGRRRRDCWLFVSARTSLQNLSWPWMQAMWRQVFP